MFQKMQWGAVFLTCQLTLVLGYNPCSDIFKRLRSTKQGELVAKLEIGLDNSNIRRHTRLEVTFTQPVQLQSNVYSSWRRGNELSHNLETTDRRTYSLIFNLDQNLQPNSSLSVNLKINYPDQYIDISSVKMNSQSLCSDPEICGEAPDSRFLIHNGNAVTRGDWPWQAALHRKVDDITLDFFCAGTLVSSRHVVTAAHCIRGVLAFCEVHDVDSAELVVLLGLHKLLEFNDQWTQSFQVSDILVHHDWAQYRVGASDGDVAVLLLNKPANFTNFVKPACLHFDTDHVGELGKIVGWGLNQNGEYSSEPQSVILPIVSNVECRESHSTFNRITTDRTFCAGFRNGSGPCQGDSGGGFLTKRTLPGDRPRFGLTGIVSRSLSDNTLAGVCDLQNYAVFTRLNSYKNWIKHDAGGLRKFNFIHRAFQTEPKDANGKACERSLTTSKTLGCNLCRGALIFEDNFDTLNMSKWAHEITMSGGGSWEFQIYESYPENSFVKDGNLVIHPGKLADKRGANFLSSGSLDLKPRCTDAEFYGCFRQGTHTNYLNPITSARLHTKGKFSFTYGRVEVRAKLPAGDWLWPRIWMLSVDKKYGSWPRSGQIDIASSRGNRDYVNNGKNIGIKQVESTLHWGTSGSNNNLWRTTWSRSSTRGFDQNFHRYQIEWTPNHIKLSLDDIEIATVAPPAGGFYQLGQFADHREPNVWERGSKMAPFDTDFFLILNVAVGGVNGFFPDNLSNPGGKPWSNQSPQAAKDFWDGRSQWESTWRGDGSENMLVDYVRVWAL